MKFPTKTAYLPTYEDSNYEYLLIILTERQYKIKK